MENNQSLQKRAFDALEYIKALEVKDQESLNLANKALVRIGQIRKGILAYFADPKKKAKATHQAIVDKEKEALKPVNEAEKNLEPKIRAYVIEQRQIREEAERKAREEEERKKKEAEEAIEEAAKLENEGKTEEALDKLEEAERLEESPPPVGIPKAPVMSGIHTRTYWKWRVIELSKVPLQYFTLDSKGIDAVVQQFKGMTAIPGIEVYEETGVARSRTS